MGKQFFYCAVSVGCEKLWKVFFVPMRRKWKLLFRNQKFSISLSISSSLGKLSSFQLSQLYKKYAREDEKLSFGFRLQTRGRRWKCSRLMCGRKVYKMETWKWNTSGSAGKLLWWKNISSAQIICEKSEKMSFELSIGVLVTVLCVFICINDSEGNSSKNQTRKTVLRFETKFFLTHFFLSKFLSELRRRRKLLQHWQYN